jgi:hypothetical protein
MHIPIPIPIGARRVAAVRGVWKVVSCTRCQERYAYLLELTGSWPDDPQGYHGPPALQPAPEGGLGHARLPRQVGEPHSCSPWPRTCRNAVPCSVSKSTKDRT